MSNSTAGKARPNVLPITTPVTLRNLNGTGVKSCGCGPWLTHWKKHAAPDLLGTCSVDGCAEKATLGANVILPKQSGEGIGRVHWIAPMCTKHNAASDDMKSKTGFKLVSADVSITCAAPATTQGIGKYPRK
jgi:hypothetical protein